MKTKNIIIAAMLVLTSLSFKAQDQQYNFTDSISTFVGYWTGKPIIALRDSNPLNPTRTYFFNVLTPKVQFTRFQGNVRNDGTPTSIAWFGNDGTLNCSPMPSLTYTVNAPTSSPSHTVVNTAYRPSITKATKLNLTAITSVSMTVSGGQSGELFLQVSPDNVTYTTYSSIPASFTAALAVAVGAINGGGGQLSVDLPKGWYWKWTSTGTGVYSVKNIFETPIN